MAVSLSNDSAEPSAPTKRHHPARWVLAGLALAVVAFAIAAASVHPTSPNAVAPSPLVGKKAPALAGRLLSGGTYKLDPAGKYMLVNFFASWCAPCRAETSAFERFLAEAPAHPWGSSVHIVGVTVNDRTTSAQAFVKQLGVTWPVVFDGSGVVGLNWGVANPPQTFLVAPDGKVVTRIVGQVTSPGLVALMNLAWSTYG
ncbi:MAG: TlpA disulfide reductase family protein [Nitrospiraceae bacterium]|nr:TlpA disulfide reductase family protein [Nitrospiraceae bacterium]